MTAEFRRRRTLRAIGLVLTGTTLVACPSPNKDAGPTTPSVPTPVLTSVVVTLSAATIQVGQTATATAAGFDQNGAPIATGAVSWSTAASNVATVNVNGVVTAAAPGTTTVIASAGGKQGQQTLTVIAAPVATVSVAPTGAALAVGGTQQFTAATLDASGAVLSGRVVVWSTSDQTKVTVSTSGLATAVASGSATITATSEGKSGSAVVTVGTVPVATVTVAPATASLIVGGTQALTATPRDANGNILSGRVFTWTSSDLTKVTGTFSGGSATVTAVAAGTSTITATSEGKSGTSLITVGAAQQACTAGSALQLAVGEVRTLTAAQIASLCLGGAASATEYALIPFSHTGTAAATVQINLAGTNTSAVLVPPLAPQGAPLNAVADAERARLLDAGEAVLRARERREINPLITRQRAARSNSASGEVPSPSALVSNPVVGQVVSLNSNGTDGCTNPRVRSARIVSVSTRSIVLVETTAPTGGFTDAELSAFGAAFDSQVYGLDVQNFGAPTDIDNNSRIGIFFTTGVNIMTTDPTQGVVGGFFHSRDLLTLAQCPGSNFGEMFYMPVPDPASTLNGSYRDKSAMSNKVIATLAHEFQHLINAARRIYVNTQATSLEEVWLNEGLSHIAEELLYYQQSGLSPRTNLGLSTVASTQAQLDVFNTYAAGNFARLISYVMAPGVNSPYGQGDALETRGAIWQLLRYASDRKGGSESSTWFTLVNAVTVGQTNFNAVFGDIVGLTRDWAIAQFTDDAGLGVSSIYTNPSWNFRSVLPAFFTPTRNPLATLALLSGTPRTFTLSGGGAVYVRFRVLATTTVTVAATSSGAPVPASVDFILVRTQ